MKDTLVLKNGTVIELEAGASLGGIQVLAADKDAMVATWEQFTADNLAEVHVKSSGGTVDSVLTNLLLVHETSVVQSGGTILTTYVLRQKNDLELRIDKLEIGQEVQDGAIEDVAAVTSAMADQIGGV